MIELKEFLALREERKDAVPNAEPFEAIAEMLYKLPTNERKLRFMKKVIFALVEAGFTKEFIQKAADIVIDRAYVFGIREIEILEAQKELH